MEETIVNNSSPKTINPTSAHNGKYNIMEVNYETYGSISNGWSFVRC
jgi:hypothetical protein